MKAQDIMPQYGTVVAEYDVKKMLCIYGDVDEVVDDIIYCVEKFTSKKWANSVFFNIKDMVRGVEAGDPNYKVGGRAEMLDFVFDNYIFLGYDPNRGVILRRRI